MLSTLLLAYTAVMLVLHVGSRWMVRRMLMQPRMFWSVRWLARVELGYYVLLGAFAVTHPGRLAVWPAAIFGTLHLASWAAAEYHPALSAALDWTPRLARRVNEIAVFDLVEAAFLVYLGYLLLGK